MAEGFEVRRRVAQFRGIPIEILSSTRSGGRRLDVHEFGKREKPWAEDLGRATRSFTVRGLVIGADHDLDGQRLEEAFEKNGPGELILPHRAPISVAVRSYRFEEPERATRVQTFEVEFVEAGVPSTPGARPNTSGEVKTRGEAAFEAMKTRLGEVFSIDGETAAAVDRISAVTADAAAAVETAFDALKATVDTIERVAQVADTVRALENRLQGTLADAAVAGREFQNAIDEILDLPFAPIQIFRALAPVAEFGDELTDPGSETVARANFKRNQDGFVRFVKQTASVARARALSDVDFETDGFSCACLRNEIAEELDALIVEESDALGDDTVATLRAVRTAIIRDIDIRGARLPGRVDYSPPTQLPALVIAQRLYGDPSRDLEIVTRNEEIIRNPGRVPFGVTLEVLAGE